MVIADLLSVGFLIVKCQMNYEWNSYNAKGFLRELKNDVFLSYVQKCLSVDVWRFDAYLRLMWLYEDVIFITC